MTAIDTFHDFVRYVQAQGGLGIEGIAIADGERVVEEHRFAADLARNIYSHTKSYVSTAIGVAVDEGLLALDDRLVDAFRADGAYGQITTVLPEQGLIVAMQCHETGDFDNVIRPAVHERLMLPLLAG